MSACFLGEGSIVSTCSVADVSTLPAGLWSAVVVWHIYSLA